MTKSKPTVSGLGFLKALPPIEELVIAAGLGLILFLRPWFDGITYPEYNVPFTWACGALAAFWAVMVLLGRMHVRFLLPVSLLAVFLLVAVATAPFTVQYDATYRGLINWTGYLLLFCVAANGLRSRASIAIVVGCFAVTSIAESLYAVLHVTYIMPRTREAVMRDPTLLQTYFNTNTMTPELVARMESNRAYGSLLFANALACWLLTGIPLAIAATNGIYLRIEALLAGQREKGAEPPHGPAERSRVFYSTLAVGVFAFASITLYYMIFFIFAYGERADLGAHIVRWTIYCVGIPSAITAAAWMFASRHGAYTMLLAVSAIVCALFGITAVYGLGATYSRGGMLAAGVSLVVLVWLMYTHRRAPVPQAAQRAAAALIIAASLLPFAERAIAQQAPQPAPALQQSAPKAGTLAVEGINPSWQAMTDPNTALLRFGYWISGVHMFAAHPITGVGLGNFSAAYPHYQIAGAGDVKPAHNDYLQAACETGVFGLLAFLGFWGYFAIANFRGVLRETDRAQRWFRAGVFASVLGFLMHSFVDFNFFNASLAALAFVLAGSSFALMPAEEAPASNRGRLLAVAVLALFAWTGYAGNRVSQADNALGRDLTRRVRLAMVDKLNDWVTQPARGAAQESKMPFMAFESAVALLIEDPAVRDTMGQLLIPTGPTSYRRPQQGEKLPPTARRLMPPESREAVRKATMGAIAYWIDRSVNVDAAYPHDPTVSASIVQWYDKLRQCATDPAEKVRAADGEIAWSEICVTRSPLQTAYYDALAKALWDRGELETTAKQIEYYDRAIDNWRRRTELYPVKPVIWREFAANCIAYGEQRVKAGDKDGGQKLIDEGNRANQHAAELEARIQEVALGRG